MRPTEERCERRGCQFGPELVLINDRAVPARFCGDGCRDFAWMDRGLSMAPPTSETVEARRSLATLGRLLDGREYPSQIGALLGSSE